MKERPILFSGPMVRAILEGRKTMTRRAVKQNIAELLEWLGGADGADDDRELDERLGQRIEEEGLRVWCADYPEEGSEVIRCPYGNPGDRLWVRETWQGPILDDDQLEKWRQDGPEWFKNSEFCVYRATDTIDAVDEDGNDLGWRPSIHMPRWASRITLEITAVRVERLQDISEDDAKAEGAMYHDGRGIGHSGWRHDYKNVHADARSSFARLWQEINGDESWNANPFVWVVEFKRVQP